MGYSLYITRSKRIKKQEWLDLVKRDRWLKLHADDLPHANLMVNGEPAGILMWSNGQIEVNSPDEPMFKKMLSIAKRLDAKIQGDDGELYTSLKDWRVADDPKGFARMQERTWQPFDEIAYPLLEQAGFQVVKTGYGAARIPRLPSTTYSSSRRPGSVIMELPGLPGDSALISLLKGEVACSGEMKSLKEHWTTVTTLYIAD